MVATLAKSGTNGYALSNQRSFDAWGNVRIGATAGNPTGRYCANIGHRQDDESGLIYMRARYYEPTSGRFVSEDPAKDGVNWFVYCSNDPVSQMDSNGKTSEFVDILFKSMAWSCATVGTALVALAVILVGKAYSPAALQRVILTAALGLALVALGTGARMPATEWSFTTGAIGFGGDTALGLIAKSLDIKTLNAIQLEFTAAAVGTKTKAAIAVYGALALSMACWVLLIQMDHE